MGALRKLFRVNSRSFCCTLLFKILNTKLAKKPRKVREENLAGS